MADQLKRIEEDRALYERNVRDHLVETIRVADPRIVARAIVSAIEQQIIAEELLADNHTYINDEIISEFVRGNREYLNKQMERAVNGFICSIVSQEG